MNLIIKGYFYMIATSTIFGSMTNLNNEALHDDRISFKEIAFYGATVGSIDGIILPITLSTDLYCILKKLR